MSFGQEKQNISNINTVKVLIFNPIDPYISVHSKRGSVTHSSSRDRDKMWITDRKTPMNTTTLATAVQRRWACDTRTVLPAEAYGRQRCNVVLSTCSVVYLWCVSWAVCSLERATKPVRTYKVGLIQRNPGNGLIHSRKKKL